MDYHLIVLSHGDSATLPRSLASFYEHVTPGPERVTVVYDGAFAVDRIEAITGAFHLIPPDVTLCPGELRQMCTGGLGFCGATAVCWKHAGESREPYIFHLEHDFVFAAPVDLTELAAVLEADRRLAQIALKRQPVSPAERRAGGYVQLKPEQYRPVTLVTDAEWNDGLAATVVTGSVEYLEHGVHFTTNPSLFRAAVAAAYSWPVQAECEGHMTIKLRDDGYRFALLGTHDSPPVVQHIGTRDGFGY